MRLALRRLRRQALMSVVIVITIGLSISVNTALFSFADGLLFRPLPYPDAQRIVQLQPRQRELMLLTQSEFAKEAIRLEETLRSTPLLSNPTRVVVRKPFDDSSQAIASGIRAAFVSPYFVSLFGARPVIGRGFTDEDAGTKPQAVLLGYDFWQEKFGGDPDVIDRTVPIPGPSSPGRWRVVGVLPAGFRFPGATNVWIAAPLESGRRPYVPTFARLSSGGTLEALRAELPFATVSPLRDVLRPRGAEAFVYLLAAAALLLIVAWVHIAGLMFSQAFSRTAEAGICMALGAERWRLIAQFATEAGIIGFVALCVASLATAPLVGALAHLLPPEVAGGLSVEPSWRVFAYAASVSLAGVLVLVVCYVGLLTHANPEQLLRGGVVRGRPVNTIRLRFGLFGTQLALATCLLYVSGLLLQSFTHVMRVDLGFEPRNLFAVRLPRDSRPLAEHREMLKTTLVSLRGLTAVQSASTASAWPMNLSATDWLPIRLSHDFGTPAVDVRHWHIGLGYPSTTGIRVLAGREPTEEEILRLTGPPAVGLALASRDLAQRLGGIHTVIGQIVVDRSIPYEIAGVVEDIKVQADQPTEPILLGYFPGEAQGEILLVKLSDDRSSAATVLGHLQRTWGSASVRSLISVEDLVQAGAAEYRAHFVILSTVAAVSIALSVMGLFASIRYATTVRHREIAVRLALGACRRDILTQVLRAVAIPVVPGMFVGLCLGLGFGKVLQHHLYGVGPLSLTTVATVLVGLGVLCGLAALWPSAAAARIDPAKALRDW